MRSTFFLLLITLMSASQPLQAVSAEDLLLRVRAALGHAEGSREIRSIRIQGETRQGSQVVAFSAIKRQPNLLRIDYRIQGQEWVKLYDGERGWMWEVGNGLAELLDDPQTDWLRRQAWVLPHWVYQTETLQNLRASEIYLDREGQGPVYDLSWQEGPWREKIVINAFQFLPVRQEISHSEGELMVIAYQDYQTSDGIDFPRTIKMSVGGDLIAETRIFEVQINTGVMRLFFQPPHGE